ncbi:MAG: hypothetical protein IIB07_10745, partial [Bacteroidetes bacterium]|nr:hypothetical protein [Bacteroidota bacterium]
KILPHNFCELVEASVKILKGKNPKLFPDFLTGGLMDVADYNDGERGGKIRVRSKIEVLDKKTLIINEILYGTTTSLIESIVKANDKGKIKIKKVIDNTAKDVEIEIQLAPGQSPDIAIDALYAFTDCELSISPNACVVIEDKPHFLSVSEILKVNTRQTVDLLQRELEIKKGELLEKMLFSSLEKIFIENLNLALKSELKIVACCCGHGKYPMTIVCSLIYVDGNGDKNKMIFEFISGKGLYKKSRKNSSIINIEFKIRTIPSLYKIKFELLPQKSL